MDFNKGDKVMVKLNIALPCDLVSYIGEVIKVEGVHSITVRFDNKRDWMFNPDNLNLVSKKSTENDGMIVNPFTGRKSWL